MNVEMEMDSAKSEEPCASAEDSEVLEFKKPLLPIFIKRAKVKKTDVTSIESQNQPPNEKPPSETANFETKIEETDIQNVVKKGDDSQKLLQYPEPPWSGVCDDNFNLEVLKSGQIIDSVDLNNKAYITFGRHVSCAIHLEHPSVSRFHAILQYRPLDSNNIRAGFYVYDLGSVHGTFINKKKIEPHIYYRFHVGHMMKFGGSTRMFILQGPEEEIENDKDVETLKEENPEKADAEEGINWGMGDDAVEDNIPDNPFTLDGPSENEELYLDDPKRTLRGWFEREGYELEYKCHEEGYGRFLCCVELPVDGPNGEPMIAQASIKGKKKEAVHQCALEACRMLDKQGLLRQSQRDSHSKKSKNWEDNDFYDSDDDEFLDRTGEIEEKRKRRMMAAGKIDDQPNTFEALEVVHNNVLDQICEIEKLLEEIRQIEESEKAGLGDDLDSLDAFMSSLKQGPSDTKQKKKSLKLRLVKLQQEEKRLSNMLKVAKPTSLPPLKVHKEPPHTEPPVRPPSKDNPSPKHNHSNNDGARVEGSKGDSEAESEMSIAAQLEDKDSVEMKMDVLSPETESVAAETKRVKLKLPAKKSLGPHLPPSLVVPSKRKRDERLKSASGKKKDNKYDYEEDEKYAVWLPPEDQSGDGKTKLNERFGY